MGETSTVTGSGPLDQAVASNGGRQPDEEPLTGSGKLGVPSAPEPHPPLRTMPSSRGFVPTLLGTLVFFISLAAIVTVALYIVIIPTSTPVVTPPATRATTGDTASDETAVVAVATEAPASRWNDWKHIIAPLAGTLVGLLGALLFALHNREYTQPDRIDPRVYGELRERLGMLDALLPALCPPAGPARCDYPSPLTCAAACNEAWARRDFINSEMGSRGTRWALGSGYIDLWRHLHAAEEALFVVQPLEDVVGNGLYDQLRLEGAGKIPNRQMLQTRLQSVLAMVGPPMTWPPTDQSDTKKHPGLLQKDVTLQEGALGRVIVRDIRRAINNFRDGERANLVRARNQLAWTGTITAMAGYTLLMLAVFAQAPREEIIGAVAYYLVGATVGLFNQLHSDSGLGEGEEDFGFNRARLFYIPVLSGLAAVGGVLVVALLVESVDFSTFGSAAAGTDTGSQPIGSIFNVHTFGVGLLVAAVFGLTPDLLLKRLERKAKDYQAGLNTSSAAAGDPAAMGPLQQLRGSGPFVPRVDIFGPR